MVASAEGHAQALANVVQANLEAVDLVRNDRNGLWISSEGFDIPVAVRDTPDAAAEVAQERALGWLVWDLHFGVEPGIADYFDMVDTQQLDRIRSLSASDGLVAGLDIYPVSVNAIGGVRPNWSPRQLIQLAEKEIERWHDRYDQPFWIAETSNLTLPIDQQIPWLEEFSSALGRLRLNGRPAQECVGTAAATNLTGKQLLSNPLDRSPRLDYSIASGLPVRWQTGFKNLRRARQISCRHRRRRAVSS